MRPFTMWAAVYCLVALAALHASVGFLQDESTAELPGLHYVPGEKLTRVILDSDESWLLMVLESDQKCGKPCADIKAMVSSVYEKSGKLSRFAYIHASDSVLGEDGDMVPAHQAFNITTIPHMLVFGAGPKRMSTALKLDPQMAGALLGQGAKVFYSTTKMFSPGMVTPVRSGNLKSFLTSPAPALPRVLLITDKREVSNTLRKLSMDFEPRAIIGQLNVGEAGGKIAAAFDITEEDVPVLLAGPSGGIPAEKLEDTVLKKLPAGHLRQGWTQYTGSLSYEPLRKYLYSSLPLVPIPQLRSQADYLSQCEQAADVTLCFIAVLPPEAEAAALARAKEKLDPEDAFLPITGFEPVDDDEDDEDGLDDDEEGIDSARARQRIGARVIDVLSRVANRLFVKVDWVGGAMHASRGMGTAQQGLHLSGVVACAGHDADGVASRPTAHLLHVGGC